MVSTRRWDGFSPWRLGCIGKAAGPYNWRCFPWRPAMRPSFGSWQHPLCSWERWSIPLPSTSSLVASLSFGRCTLLYGHRHRVRVGMTAGVLGLALWSFLMATAHGAGLMLLRRWYPWLSMPIIGRGSLLISLAAVAVHTLATLVVTGLISLVCTNGSGSRSCGGAGLFRSAVDGRLDCDRPNLLVTSMR